MILLTAPGHPLLTREVLDLIEVLHAEETPAPPVDAPPDWRVAPLPGELLTRKVELVVPASDARELQAGLDAQPGALVLDLDDTFSPTWANVLAAHENIWRLGGEYAGILMLRPRGLHFSEGHAWVNGEIANAGLFDVAVALTSLAPRLRSGRHVYLYLPKIETPGEARRWEAVITRAEEILRLPRASVRVGVQIETFPAARDADAILYALRDRAFGLNAGRWDYFCSFVKHHPDVVLPERSRMHMGLSYLSAYARRLVQVASQRGAQAIGGTAAMVPDTANPQLVFERVREDKRLEARLGFTAAWAGHPSLVRLVDEVFSEAVEPDSGPTVGEAELTDVPPAGVLSVPGARDTIALCLEYLRHWRAGQGNLQRAGRLEDLATVEFARAQLWQWVRREHPLDDGSLFTLERYRSLREELGRDEVACWLDQLVSAERCPPYFARVIYPALIQTTGASLEVKA